MDDTHACTKHMYLKKKIVMGVKKKKLGDLVLYNVMEVKPEPAWKIFKFSCLTAVEGLDVRLAPVMFDFESNQ